jgi:predicted transcriptional regulator
MTNEIKLDNLTDVQKEAYENFIKTMMPASESLLLNEIKNLSTAITLLQTMINDIHYSLSVEIETLPQTMINATANMADQIKRLIETRLDAQDKMIERLLPAKDDERNIIHGEYSEKPIESPLAYKLTVLADHLPDDVQKELKENPNKKLGLKDLYKPTNVQDISNSLSINDKLYYDYISSSTDGCTVDYVAKRFEERTTTVYNVLNKLFTLGILNRRKKEKSNAMIYFKK